LYKVDVNLKSTFNKLLTSVIRVINAMHKSFNRCWKEEWNVKSACNISNISDRKEW